MFNFWTVVYLILVGLLAGYVARWLVKGSDEMTWWQTMLLGIVRFLRGRLRRLPSSSAGDDDEGFLQASGCSSRSSARSSRS